MDKAISILGTGNMAKGLAKLFSDAGVAVVMGSRNPTQTAAAAAAIGKNVRTADLREAVGASKIVVLAVPYSAVKDVIASCGPLAGKVLIDISNPITPDYKELTVGFSTSAAEEIQKQVTGAHVVKAFNTIFAQLLPTAARAGSVPVQVFLAGDDATAKSAVSDLVQLTGFAAIDAGALKNSRYLEPIGEMNIHFGFMLGWGTATAPMWQKIA